MRPVGSASNVDSEEHAAVRAWVSLSGSRPAPETVETLKERKGRPAGVYRFRGIDSRGSSVVAKRCALRDAEHERTVYEKILPQCPLTTVHYYGFVADPTNSVGWLFLEDAGDTWYSPTLQPHRALAAKWLGVLHTHGREAAASFALPDRGLAWYRTRVRSAIGLLEQALQRGALSGPDASRLARLATWCAATEARWPEVAGFCEDMPSTLVHADFVGENVRVRDEGTGLALLPFDWGTAGWGVPARDLVGIDLAGYSSTVRSRWPAVAEKDLRRLARVGRLFRKIAAVHRACMSLPYAPVQKVLSDMRFLLVRA
jgi:hypothetical protein